MISFVDLAPTILSLAGVEPPKYMEGKPFLGKYDNEERDYIFASSDRFDEFTDRIRATRDKQYLYVRNDFPELPKYKDLAYRRNIPMMDTFLELREAGKLNQVQQIWFQTKTKEELYDCINDPFQINNLADAPEYHDVLLKMRGTLNTHFENRPDFGLTPEAEMIANMWPNNQQPTTKPVNVSISNTSKGKNATLSCDTKGASMAYIISDQPIENLDFNSPWQLYTAPIAVENGKLLYTIAHRIGFKASDIVSEEL